jgi:class 3 adenylate cyclase
MEPPCVVDAAVARARAVAPGPAPAPLPTRASLAHDAFVVRASEHLTIGTVALAVLGFVAGVYRTPGRWAIVAWYATCALLARVPAVREARGALAALSCLAATVLVIVMVPALGTEPIALLQIFSNIFSFAVHLAPSRALTLTMLGSVAAFIAVTSIPATRALLPAALRPAEALRAPGALFLAVATALAFASAARMARVRRRCYAALEAAAASLARADAVLACLVPAGAATDALRNAASDALAVSARGDLVVVFVRLVGLRSALSGARLHGLEHLSTVWTAAALLAARRGVTIVETVGFELVAMAPGGDAGAQACVDFVRDFAHALQPADAAGAAAAGAPAAGRAAASGRIVAGIAGGDVVSGLVGTTYPQFTLVGAPVNLAARMASLADALGGAILVLAPGVFVPAGARAMLSADVKGVGELDVHVLDLSTPPPVTPSSAPILARPQVPVSQPPAAAAATPCASDEPAWRATLERDFASAAPLAALALAAVVALRAPESRGLLAAGIAALAAAWRMRAASLQTALVAAFGAAALALPLGAPNAGDAAQDACLLAVAASCLGGTVATPTAIALMAVLTAVARFAIAGGGIAFIGTLDSRILFLAFANIDILRVARGEFDVARRALIAAERSAAAQAAATADVIRRLVPAGISRAALTAPDLLDPRKGMLALPSLVWRHADAAVLSADIVGYTGLAARLSAAETVRVLNAVVGAMEAALRARGASKVRTVGDCFIAVAGLDLDRAEGAADEATAGKGATSGAEDAAERSRARAQNVALLVRVADEFHAAAARLSAELGHALALRIGIDVGDVVVGALRAKGGLRSDLFGGASASAKDAEAAASPRQTRLTAAAQDAFRTAALT